MIEIPCHCGNIIKAEMSSEIDLSTTEGLYARIVEGDFMNFSCPECGNEIKAEVGLHLFDPAVGFDLQFIPELERTNFLRGHISTNAARVAIGYPELVEKVIIAGAGLDDRIIEIIKFRLLEKADRTDINIYMNGLDNDQIVFHIQGLKPDQIGITRVPTAVYGKIETELDELLENEDIRLFTEGPYVSVTRVYLED